MMKQKLKIMKTRPQVTEEEIRSYMDFDSIVAKHKQGMSNGSKWFLYFATAIISASVGIAIYFYSLSRGHESSITPQEIPVDTVNNSKIETHEPVQNLAASDNKKEFPKMEEKSKKALEASKADVEKPTDSESAATQYKYVEAQPIEGFPVLYEYLNKELHYPEAAVKDSIEGIVTVFFIINKEGKPVQVSIENSLGEVFDQEAIRLIQHMPLWKPATVNGNPVQSRISIPLTFQISKSKNTNQ
jgi:TonB family protein